MEKADKIDIPVSRQADVCLAVAIYISDMYDIDNLNSVTRKREVVKARQLCHYFLMKNTKMSLSVVGQYIGGKDHATVLHSCRTINNLMDAYPAEKLLIINLNNSIIKVIQDTLFEIDPDTILIGGCITDLKEKVNGNTVAQNIINSIEGLIRKKIPSYNLL